MPSPTLHTLTPVVAVINMKGGVGKTTITGNVFRELFRRKRKRTLLIDFDPQYNLSQLLLTRVAYDALKAQKKTIWYVMEPEAPHSVFSTSENSTLEVVDCDTYTTRLRYLTGAPNTVLRLLPGDFQLARLNLRDSNAMLRVPRERFRSFVEKAKQSYDLVVLDCNPSSSFLTRTAIEVATHLLMPVRPDKYSTLGVEMLAQYIKELPNLVTVPEPIILINDLPSNAEAESIMNELRGHTIYGPQMLIETLPHTKILAARPDYTGFAVDRQVPYSKRVGRILAKVADELALRIGVV